MPNHTIAVLGAGSWGTALACLLARNGSPVTLWGRDADRVEAMRQGRVNERYLPGVSFPEALAVESDFGAAVAAGHLLLVVPSHAFRATLEDIARVRGVDEEFIVSWGTKGFEPQRSILLSEVIAEVLPAARRAVLSGPSFAREVAGGLPTALTVASDDPDVAKEVAGLLRNDRVRVYTNTDLAGVQLGGAIKNVMALAAGISDGLGFGANARAALITRGLAEMNRLGVALGGQPQTFMGLTGVGDLVLTCTDDQSRNRRVGLGLGQGKSLPTVLEEIGQEAEGVQSTRELHATAQRLDVEMPITEQVFQVLYRGLDPLTAVDRLFEREPKAE